MLNFNPQKSITKKLNNRMKKTLIISIICISLLSFRHFSNQPLENTRWEGQINVPAPTDAIFEFKKDSFLLFVNGDLFETMQYNVSGDSLRIKKLDGNSPCNNENALYTFSIKENKLYIKAVDDPCTIRAGAFGEYYSKQ